MALKREDKRVFESEKEKGRKGGRREGEKWGIGGFFASRGAWALNKTRKCWSFLHHLGLSPQPRAGLGLPASEGKCHPSAQSGTECCWRCPLWPPDKNVRSQVLSYPKSIWCVVRIENKRGRPPLLPRPPSLSGSDLLSWALGVRPRLVPRRVLRKGASKHPARSKASGASAPSARPAGAEWISHSPWQTALNAAGGEPPAWPLAGAVVVSCSGQSSKVMNGAMILPKEGRGSARQGRQLTLLTPWVTEELGGDTKDGGFLCNVLLSQSLV